MKKSRIVIDHAKGESKSVWTYDISPRMVYSREWTGERDMFGKKIYCGDIIEFKERDCCYDVDGMSRNIWIVEKGKEGKFRLAWPSGRDLHALSNYAGGFHNITRKIGNIYTAGWIVEKYRSIFKSGRRKSDYDFGGPK